MIVTVGVYTIKCAATGFRYVGGEIYASISSSLGEFYKTEKGAVVARESSERMRKTQKRCWADPEYREKMREILRQNALKRYKKEEVK